MIAPERLAGAPISWGVCEVPGWGEQLEPHRVLSEMRSLGLHSTEAGPDGYLGSDAASIKALLAEHGLHLVGGFLPLVLHEPAQTDAALAKARATCDIFAEAGGRVLCTAAIADEAWTRIRLSADGWKQLLSSLVRLDDIAAERGLLHVLHPHWATVVEQDEDVRRLLDESDALLCLDTGHLSLGGSDPVGLARTAPKRFAHVHLKDVRTEVCERLRAGTLSLLEAVEAGLFQPLGEGNVPVGGVVLALESAGYDGWYVLEQDVALADDPTAGGPSPLDDVRRSVEFLRALAADRVRAAAASEGR